MIWVCVTNILIPILLIFFIWGMMVHHFIVNPCPPKGTNCRSLKRVTMKMVCITGFFLLTTSPAYFFHVSAIFETPKLTKWNNLPSLWLLNGFFQPILYILLFKSLREVVFKVICCGRFKKERRSTMSSSSEPTEPNAPSVATVESQVQQ